MTDKTNKALDLVGTIKAIASIETKNVELLPNKLERIKVAINELSPMMTDILTGYECWEKTRNIKSESNGGGAGAKLVPGNIKDIEIYPKQKKPLIIDDYGLTHCAVCIKKVKPNAGGSAGCDCSCHSHKRGGHSNEA